MSVPERTRAVLLDALGTLVHFEPPAPLLRAALRERLGIEVPDGGRGGGDQGRDRVLPRPPARGPRRGLAGRPAAAQRGGDAPGAGRRRRASPTCCSPRCASTPIPTPRRRCGPALARPGDRGGVQLGPLAARAPGRDRPRAAGRRRGRLRRARARQAGARRSSSTRSSWPAPSRARRCTPATRRGRTWRARSRPGCGRCSWPAAERPARTPACRSSPRSPSCRPVHTLESSR